MTLKGYIVGTKGNTGRGIASIVENADYTITINLTDGTSYTTDPIAGFTEVAFDENYDLVVTKTDGTQITVETDLDSYRSLLEGYKSDAETAKSNASGYATSASGSASTATTQATLARSYAKGDTSSRTGEATDNADYYRGLASSSASSASASASSAETNALKSEGYAVGKQGGTDVSSGSPYYHANAKYYSEQASSSAANAGTSETNASSSASSASTNSLKSEGYAVGKQNGTDVGSGSTYYHNNAKYYEAEASSSATSASGSASSASASALVSEGFAVGQQNGTDVSSGSPYYENNAKYYADEAYSYAQSLVIEDELDEDSTNALENGVITKALGSKANQHGTYDGLAVGTAKEVISEDAYTVDTTPYRYRAMPYVSKRLEESLVGGSVVWNQLVQNGNFASASGWYKAASTTLEVANNVAKVTQTAQYQGITTVLSSNPLASGHKYLIIAEVKADSERGLDFVLGDNTYFTLTGAISVTTEWATYGKIINVTSANVAKNSQTIGIRDSHASGFVPYYVKNFNCADLTAFFASATVADAIYAMEQAQAGSGIALLKASGFFNGYIPYDTGTIKSVEATAHKIIGVNAWDEEWELYDAVNLQIKSKNRIPLIESATYYVKTSKAVTIYFAQGLTGSTFASASAFNNTFTVPTGAHYGIMYTSGGYGTTYKNDICINISDPTINGKYFPYEEHTYQLGDVVLRGIPKLVNNELVYDGDIYTHDGTVTRKYGIVDLGTLNWTYIAGDTVFRADLADKKDGNAQFICSKYTRVADAGHATPDYCISYSNSSSLLKMIFIGDPNYTDAATFKTAMSGVYLVYELATPTTETTTPFEQYQICTTGGTEEYTTTNDVPVGHETKYYTDLAKKLVDLPFDMSMIAPVEVEYKATRNYSVGDYLIVNNTFYKVTSSIANGGTITPNTNVTATTVATELIALR